MDQEVTESHGLGAGCVGERAIIGEVEDLLFGDLRKMSLDEGGVVGRDKAASKKLQGAGDDEELRG